MRRPRHDAARRVLSSPQMRFGACTRLAVRAAATSCAPTAQPHQEDARGVDPAHVRRVPGEPRAVRLPARASVSSVPQLPLSEPQRDGRADLEWHGCARRTSPSLLRARHALAARLAAGPLSMAAPHSPGSPSGAGCPCLQSHCAGAPVAVSAAAGRERLRLATLRAVRAVRLAGDLLTAAVERAHTAQMGSGAVKEPPRATPSQWPNDDRMGQQPLPPPDADGSASDLHAQEEEDRPTLWSAFFSRGEGNPTSPGAESPHGPASSRDALWLRPQPAYNPSSRFHQMLRAHHDSTLTGCEALSLLRWCGGEMTQLATIIAQTAAARERLHAERVRRTQVWLATAPTDNDCLADTSSPGSAMNTCKVAPPQRQNSSASTGCAPRPAHLPADERLPALDSPFTDAVLCADVLESAAELQVLLGSFLHTLVEVVLVAGPAADDLAVETAIGHVAADVSTAVLDAVANVAGERVLRPLAVYQRQMQQREQQPPSEPQEGRAAGPQVTRSAERAARGALEGVWPAASPASPVDPSVSPQGSDGADSVPLGLWLLTTGARRLRVTDAVTALAVCSQRESSARAVDVAYCAHEVNVSLARAVHGDERHLCGDAEVATPPPVTQRDKLEYIASTASHDVKLALSCVLAQHGEWEGCVLLLEHCSSTSAETSVADASQTRSTPASWPRYPAAASLLVALALANAPECGLERALAQCAPAAPTASSSPPRTLLAALLRDEEASAARGDGAPRRDRSSTCREALLFHLVSLGVVPARSLSVTEYAALLRRVLRQPRSFYAAPTPPPSSSATRSAAEAGGANGPLSTGSRRAARRSVASGDRDGSWVLSPSRVWQHTAGLPHHVRTALCVLSFEVAVKHALQDSMSMEDLLVVLSVTRQLRRHREQALSTRCQRLRQRDRGANAAVGAMTDGYGSAEEMATESTTALSGAFPATLLPALRRTAPAGQRHLLQLCGAYTAVVSSFYVHAERQRQRLRLAPQPQSPGSAALLSVVSHELLSLLTASHYTHAVDRFWQPVLTAVGAVLPHEGLTLELADTLERLARALVTAIDESLDVGNGESNAAMVASASAASPGGNDEACSSVGDLSWRHGVADTLPVWRTTAAAQAGPTMEGSSLSAGSRADRDGVATGERLLEPLMQLAPYLSPLTIALIVQSAAGRLLSWQQCLHLLPYAPLGSHSQTQLLRRVAQDGRDPVVASRLRALLPAHLSMARRGVGAMLPVPGHARASTEPALSVGARAVEMTEDESTTPDERSRRRHLQATSVARAHARSILAQEQDIVALLLERDWHKALSRFRDAPLRVRAAGAPYVVRLIIEADAWRELDGRQLHRLLSLAVRSSHSRSAHGARDFAEDVLRQTLQRGQWWAGLHFHELVASEQPDLVRSSQRARQYAMRLCQGLMQKTALSRAMAEVLRATRAGQWEQASAYFLLYATGRSVDAIDEHGAHKDADAGAASPDVGRWPGAAQHRLSLAAARRVLDETTSVLAQMRSAAEPQKSVSPAVVAGLETGDRSQRALALPVEAAARAVRDANFPRATPEARWPFLVHIPAALTEFAQATRYALLQCPQTAPYAFEWFPATALPVSCSVLEELKQQGWRAAACADTPTVDTAADAYGSPVPLSNAMAARASAAVTPPPPPPPATASVPRAGEAIHRPEWVVAKSQQEKVRDALVECSRRGDWRTAVELYACALAQGCLPYQAAAVILRTTLTGGAPWEVTLATFTHMAQRMRPDVLSTAAALEACAAGGQWAMAFRVLRQSVLTQSHPAPRAVELAVNTALRCGVWARALQAAHQYRATRSPQLAHTILQAYVITQHWNDAVEYFYDCTVRGIRPLDASIELALAASEAASEEHRQTAMLVGTIASALEDLYAMTGAVLEHIVFVHRHSQWQQAGHPDHAAAERAASMAAEGPWAESSHRSV